MIQLLRRSRSLVVGFSLALLLAVFQGAAPTFVGLGKVQSATPAEQGLTEPGKQALDQLDAGRAAYQSQRIGEAIGAWQSAAQSFEVQGDRLHQALALSYLSLAHQYSGEWPQATAAIAQSIEQLKQWRASGGSQDSHQTLVIQGQVLNTQGALQFAQGSLAPALESWQRAGAFYQQAGDPRRYTGSLINQARTLQSLGYFLQARRVLDQVQTELDQSDLELQVLGLHSLGDTLRVIGDFDAAAAAFAQCLEIAQAQSMLREQAALLLSLGHLARRQQQASEALAFYRQAEAIAADSLQQAQAGGNQFSLLVEMKAWGAAQTLADSLQLQFKSLPPSRASLYAQTSFAHHLIQSRRPGAIAQAAALLGTAMQQAQAIGDRYAEAYAMGYLGSAYEATRQWAIAKDVTEGALLIAQSLNANDVAYQWQWQLGRILKARGQRDGAMSAYEGAFLSLQALRYDLATIASDQQFSFRESVEPVYRDYVDLLLSPDYPSPARMQQARKVIESLQLAELNNFFQSACIEGQTVALDDIDQTDAAIIYPIVLSDRLEVIVSLPDRPLQRRRIEVPGEQVKETLDALRQNLTRPFVTPAGKTLGEVAYGWLIRPIEVDLQESGVKTLVFVPDGVLRSVPMAALFDGEHYLVENYSIALTSGLRLIAPRPLRQQRIRALAGGLTEARHGFGALENVGAELAQVEATVPSRVLVDQAFTREALREQVESSPYPVVHLATHGQFSSQADETFILTWDGPLNVNEISAVLRAGDETRKAPIELLILSACETATGDGRAALGLAGVAVQAGARSTIASLWSLDDASGALLVSHLYDELANANISKAEALQRAQLALLGDPDYRAPVFWSSFVLVGNWL